MIIITGTSQGLGNFIANRLHEAGKTVIGLSRTRTDTRFESFQCDVSDFDAVKSFAKQIKEKKQPVEAIINAAGIAAMNLAITSPPEQTKRLISTNLLGTIFVCQTLAPIMIRQKAGTIINFSTIAVPLALKGESIYVASKAGVEGFSRAFANELSAHNINVNCIAPGPINTELLNGVSDKQIDAIVNRQLINRQFEKSDVSDLVELLLSKKSRSITGQVFHVGGV